ncbi:glycosyltransferase [Salinicoccus sp. ID82-1]|uniref:glycosyltransferase n=1 Tax=Salinicoccus sp. ID82-1 TaxID=2820269 RepID=UPI001F26970D|nr:glycosyltransferase [Salinicoccus sp. ID82-1]MCG1009960.1 glycosyltransferase [Salinicoccus sp. ID82-1]
MSDFKKDNQEMTGSNKEVQSLSEMNKSERLKFYTKLLDQDYLRAIEHLSNEKMYNTRHNYYEKFDQEGKVDFLNEIAPYFSDLGKSNGSRYFEKLKLDIGIICDEFLYHSYKDVANFHYINSEGGGLSKSLDFIIVASTWKGLDQSWEQVASPRSGKRERLMELIQHAKDLGIPVAFYSKEDPVNYDLFKDIAKECDVVYTSAEEMVEEYKSYCSNDKVYVMEFGVNPEYHNPVGSRSSMAEKNKDHVIFAGSWTKKYPVRNKESAQMFDGTKESGYDLTIIDRNLHLKRTRYQFPAGYIENLTYPMQHEDLMNTHRLFRWAINVNSVKYSETMFANRVYELQAMGNLMLTNYSMGVNNKFPHLFMVNLKEDVMPMLKNHTEAAYEDIRAKGIRQVMLNDTAYHRIGQYARNFGISTQLNAKEVLVAVDEVTALAQENFNRQMYANKTLMKKTDITSEVLKLYDFVTYFSDAYIYEEYHLEDLLSGFVYTDVDFITKAATGMHDYTSRWHDKELTMFDVDVLDENLEPAGTQGYMIPMTEVMKEYPRSLNGPKKLLSVIVPIHNNGRYLEDKCYRSLTRSSIFDKMEIIFINDGSTDEETIKIIDRLRRRNPDIRYFAFEEGSGSASRPRNKGAEMVPTKYMTYLDPDNEASGEGYADLLDKLLEYEELDMVVGNIIKEDNHRKASFRYSSTVRKYNGDQYYIEDTHKFMKHSGLRAQSIQAVIVKSEVVQKNGIKMVEGAAGQDTMFFQELMLYSDKAMAVDTFVHMYYAAVSGSVTNTIGKKFFDKYYRLEIERIPFLKKHNLLETYMQERFNFYVKGWYIVRLDRIKPEERHEAITRFLDIYSLYDGYSRPKSEELDETIRQLKNEVGYNG